MNSSRSISPGWTGGSTFLLIGRLSFVIIHDFHLVGFSVEPYKADAVLIVYPYAVLPFPVSFESFQTIPGQGIQVLKELRGLEHHQLPVCDPPCMAWGILLECSLLKTFSVSLSLKLFIMIKWHDEQRHGSRQILRQLLQWLERG